jgi:hypothetical protein
MKFLQNEITGTWITFPTNFGGKLSFILSFIFLTASTAAIYIFITLAPSALNAKFQHFILRLSLH